MPTNKLVLIGLLIVMLMVSGCIDSPGDAVKPITVGASDQSGHIAYFSGSGPTNDGRTKPTLVAPGVNIISCRASGTEIGEPVDEYYTKASGTSMSTPYAAGAAALLLQANPDLTPAGVKAALTTTAVKLNNMRGLEYEEFYQGTGEIDAYQAYLAANNDSLTGIVPDQWIAGAWTYTGLEYGADRPTKKIYAIAPGWEDSTRFVFFTDSELSGATISTNGTAGDWITIQPLPGSIQANEQKILDATLNVPEGVDSGTYTGNITINGNGKSLLSVPMTVNIAQLVEITNGTGTFNGSLGDKEWGYFYFDIPRGTERTEVSLRDYTDDADLFLFTPNHECIDQDSYGQTDTEIVENPSAGRWMAIVYGKDIPSTTSFNGTVDIYKMTSTPSRWNIGILKPDETVSQSFYITNDGIELSNTHLDAITLNISEAHGFNNSVMCYETVSEYFDVPAGLDRFEVTVTWNNSDSYLDIELYDPNGYPVDYSGGHSNIEMVSAIRPMPGRWEVRVDGYVPTYLELQAFEGAVDFYRHESCDWISFDNEVIGTLPCNTQTNFNATLTVPGSAEPGEHTGAIEVFSDQETFDIPVSFVVSTAMFNGINSDHGNDTDGDGLYNYLTVNVSLNVTAHGDYRVEGRLEDGGGNYLWANNSIRTTDTNQMVQINFEGTSIWKNRFNGTYNIYLYLYSKRGDLLDRGSYATSYYNHTEFQPLPAIFTDVYSDKGEDTDGDGLYDNLTIDVGVYVTDAGRYRVRGRLYECGVMDYWDYVDYDSNTTDLNAGNQTVQLRFYGITLRQNGYDGRYDLRDLRLYNATDSYPYPEPIETPTPATPTPPASGGSEESMEAYNATALYEQIDHRDITYTTLYYDHTDFQRPPAEFTGNFNDYGLDTDNDTLYDYLVIEAEINVTKAGECEFGGDLSYYDEEEGYWRGVDGDWNSTYLDAGIQNITLRFDGIRIYGTGYNGSFRTWLNLYETEEWCRIDEMEYSTSDYNYTDFQRPPAEFNDVYTDYGEDTDGDELYDYLTIEIGVDVRKDGYYRVNGELYEGNSYNSIDYDSNTTYLSNGSQTIQLRFEGIKMRQNEYNGTYDLKYLYLYNSSTGARCDRIYDAYTTSYYNYTDFQRPPAEFTDVYSDYGEDTDGDGLNNSLVIEVGVNVTKAGTYKVRGELCENATHDYIISAYNTTYLDMGDHNVSLKFDGIRLRQNRYNGTYDLKYLYLYNYSYSVSSPAPMPTPIPVSQLEKSEAIGAEDVSVMYDEQLDRRYYAYTTGYYNYTEFQRPPAEFNDVYSDYGTDTDGDWLYNYLTIEVGVNVTTAGSYRVCGELYENGTYNSVDYDSNTTYLNEGNQTVQLWFDAWKITEGGTFDLKYLYLYDDDWNQLDYRHYAYTTGYYEPLPRPALFNSVYSDHGKNTTTEDDLYDYLTIEVGVNVAAAGYYQINANLYDSYGDYIEGKSNYTYLSTGDQTVQLDFSGIAIRQNEVNGTYDLRYLYLYDDDWNRLDYIYDAYTTSYYNYTEFQRPPAEFSDVYSDYGGDTDGDGLYDNLTIEVGVNVTKAGRYRIRGELHENATPDYIISAYNTTYLDIGAHNVSLKFDGIGLRQNRYNGTYDLKYLYLRNYSSSVPPPMPMSVSQLENIGAHNVSLKFDGIGLRQNRYNETYDLKHPYLRNYSSSVPPPMPTPMSVSQLEKSEAIGTEDVSVLYGERLDYRYYAYTTSYYNYTEFQRPPAEFSDVYSDYGEDTDGDGLYDNLTIEVGVNVTTAGYYQINGNLYDRYGDYLGWANNYTYLNAGDQTVQLDFDGIAIRQNEVNGTYDLTYLDLYDDYWNQLDYIYDAYTTSYYNYTEFQRPPAEFSDVYSDYGEDTDGDGLYDNLTIEVGVNVTTAGRYQVGGELCENTTHDYIISAYNTTYLDIGAHNVSLEFDGIRLRQNRYNGTYDLKYLYLRNYSSSVPSPPPMPMSVSQLENIGSHNVSLKFDGIGLRQDRYNGTYDLKHPYLRNYSSSVPPPMPTPMSVSQLENIGAHNVSLKFDGIGLRQNRYNGTYDLKHLYLRNYSYSVLPPMPTPMSVSQLEKSEAIGAEDVSVLYGEQLDYRYYACTTGYYEWTEWQRPPAEFTDVYSDYGEDTDGDGLYNYLTIEVGVNVTTAGYYQVEGRLDDSYGDYIEWEGNYTYLNAGDQTVQLDFDGIAIRQNEVNGTYNLRYLYLYDSSTGDRVDYIYDAYTTAYYNYTEFQRPPAEFTDVYSDYGEDTDEDGLYDNLTIEVGVNVTNAGTYRVRGELCENTTHDYIISAYNTTYLDMGSHNVSLKFDGIRLRQNIYNGTYDLKYLYLYNYSYSVPPPMPTPMSVSQLENIGAHNVSLKFDGIGLRQNRYNGTYDLKHLYLRNYSYSVLPPMPTPMSVSQLEKSEAIGAEDVSVLYGEQLDYRYYACTTGYYEWTEWQRPPAEFTDVYSDYGEDTDGDGLYNYLTIEVGVNVTTAGYYQINGNLYDCYGDYLGWASNYTYLNTGDQTVQLDFNGIMVRQNGVNGTYDLRYLGLYDNNGDLCDQVYDAYTTAYYNYTELQIPPAEFNDVYSDYGTDTDGDGLYDYLTIEVGVNVREAGDYQINGELYDRYGDHIEWAYNYTYLNAGNQTVQLLCCVTLWLTKPLYANATTLRK